MADLHDYVVTAHLRAQGWEAEIRRRERQGNAHRGHY